MITEEEYVATMARGTAAATLLADETFQDVLAEVRADAIAEWMATAPGSVGLREEAYALVRGIKALEAKLRARADAAKKTSHDVAKRNAR
jgi:hypothetical protein